MTRIPEWNTALLHYASRFQGNYPDISVAVYDVHALFRSILDDPGPYGFKDAISSCHESDCIWADEVHSTFATHKIIASNMARFLENPAAILIPSKSSRKSVDKVSVFLVAFVLAVSL